MLSQAEAFELYYRHSTIPDGEPGMAGGVPGRRFLTNGHFAMVVSEDVFASALAASWRDVTATDFWTYIVSIGYGRAYETVVVPTAAPVDEDGNIRVGSVRLAARYVGLLQALGVTEVDLIHDRPMAFAIATDVAIVSAVR